MTAIRYSIITPSRGDRPNALTQAIDSLETAMQTADLTSDQVEMLVGFDGVKGDRVRQASHIRYFDFPKDGDFGNGIRNYLLKAAKGQRLIFLDDDNSLTPHALCVYETFADVEMLISRINVQRAHDMPYLPVIENGKEIVRQSNIDPLCLCLATELVTIRCGGWVGTGYQADYINMFRYYRRAKTVSLTHDIVGIYDSGRGLDTHGLNFRQQTLPFL